MKVTQIAIGRFHHFHAARQLERHGMLDAIWTGYPQFKLKDEKGIPLGKIRTFPWFQTPFMAASGYGLERWRWLAREWAWQSHGTLDRHVSSQLRHPGIVFALSGCALRSGQRMQDLGGFHVCDRGSTHIAHQDAVLREEYGRLGVEWPGVDPRMIDREEAEYAQADAITIPSEFVLRTFLAKGVPAAKLRKATYGANVRRFSKVADPDPAGFRVLWVGGVSVRKGFVDALEGFHRLRHPRKEFVVIGHVLEEMKALLRNRNLEGVAFLGSVPNASLPGHYSAAHAFLLPSVEEGLAVVQGEALACGCPVIATANTGCEDLFQDAIEGFVVPLHSPADIGARLQLLADAPELRQRMSEAAQRRVASIGGWDSYGEQLAGHLSQLVGGRTNRA